MNAAFEMSIEMIRGFQCVSDVEAVRQPCGKPCERERRAPLSVWTNPATRRAGKLRKDFPGKQRVARFA